VLAYAVKYRVGFCCHSSRENHSRNPTYSHSRTPTSTPLRLRRVPTRCTTRGRGSSSWTSAYGDLYATSTQTSRSPRRSSVRLFQGGLQIHPNQYADHPTTNGNSVGSFSTQRTYIPLMYTWTLHWRGAQILL
jgi:hypothetical protein